MLSAFLVLIVLVALSVGIACYAVSAIFRFLRNDRFDD